MSVTDEDRATARELALLCRSGVGGQQLREDTIAEALAAEREKARAPFLAALAALETAVPDESPYRAGLDVAAARIRRAAATR